MNSTWASSALFLPAISSLFTSLHLPPPLALSPALPLPSFSSSFPRSQPLFQFLLHSSLPHRPPVIWKPSPGCHSCNRLSHTSNAYIYEMLQGLTFSPFYFHMCTGASVLLKTHRPAHLKRTPLTLSFFILFTQRQLLPCCTDSLTTLLPRWKMWVNFPVLLPQAHL